jgi:hypothetical protein
VPEGLTAAALGKTSSPPSWLRLTPGRGGARESALMNWPTPLISREPGSGTRLSLERALRSVGLPLGRPLLELSSATAIEASVG